MPLLPPLAGMTMIAWFMVWWWCGVGVLFAAEWFVAPSDFVEVFSFCFCEGVAYEVHDGGPDVAFVYFVSSGGFGVSGGGAVFDWF